MFQGSPKDVSLHLGRMGRKVPMGENSIEYLIDVIQEYDQSDYGVDALAEFARTGMRPPALSDEEMPASGISSSPTPPRPNRLKKEEHRDKRNGKRLPLETSVNDPDQFDRSLRTYLHLPSNAPPSLFLCFSRAPPICCSAHHLSIRRLAKNILNRKVGASKEIHGLLILELASICVNLTLFIVFLFIISARQIFVCVGRIRLLKEDSSVANSSSIRPSSVEGEIRDVVVGIGFKLSLLCCFYVLVLQFGILGYDGVALIREVVNGKSVDWSIIGLPDAQSLTWYWDGKKDEERRRGLHVEEIYTKTLHELEQDKILQIQTSADCTKEKAAMECQRQLLSSLKEDVVKLSAKLASERAAYVVEHCSVNELFGDLQTKQERMLNTKSILEAEIEALRILR
ncbi:hypothetical protein K2173_025281 [Erythroxylum novogranatense]|uniref:Uncharacterized protein n=1 Tax=Erythroxylum novogranatense TaxID=1862640 RepID=A0AAV8UEP7_9ROSI|nr:hypothetical protein K2173_025281 [Erythroxylum novogranatense]